MKLRTSIESISYPFHISLDTKTLMLGSCFAEHIGQKMIDHKFNTSINPTGIIYNPVSLTNTIKHAINQVTIRNSDLVHNKEKYVHFDFHGKMGHHHKSECISQINTALVTLREYIMNSDLIFFSLGSAIVYELIDTHAIVSNCHKLPQQHFNKRQLTQSELINSLTETITRIQELNSSSTIIFTVSPVRHARHGLIENNRSKANLISAVHTLCDSFDCSYYFPSYEILIDDLRDYRFYSTDMVHPSETAIEYVWQYLQNSLMDNDTIGNLKSVKSLMNTYHHRSITSDIDKQISELQALQTKMSDHQLSDRFSQEIEDIEKRLLTLSTS